MQVVTMNELQARTQDVIAQAQDSEEAVIVESQGEPIVAILPFERYEHYRKVEARSAAFRAVREMAARNALASDLDEEAAIALANEVRDEMYRERNGS